MRIIIHVLSALVLISSNAFTQTSGDSFFGSQQIHVIQLTFDQTAWWDSLYASNDGEFYIMAHAVVDGVAYDSIGVKTKGNSSFNNPSDKKSLKLDFNNYVAGQKVDGLKKLNLNNGFKDPTLLREKICLDFLKDAGVIAPRATYANVYLNGELWGLYIAVEEIDKTFLDDRFGDDKGNLYKGDPHGSLTYQGSNQSSYEDDYELHTNETQNDWSGLIHVIDILNNTPANAFKDSLDAYMNVTSFIDNWAAYNLFANMDSYLGSGHKNYLYHDSITNKFYWLPWDVNESFGTFLQMMTVSQLETMSALYLSPPSNKPLLQKIIENTDYKQQYLDRICELLHSQFDTTQLFPRIDSLANWIRPSVYADPKKFFPNNQFEQNLDANVNNIPGLKSFLQARINSLTTEMATLGCVMSTVAKMDSKQVLTVYPNPTQEMLFVNGATETIEIFNAVGTMVMQQTKINGLVAIQVSELPAGVYTVKSNGIVKKFIKL